MEGKIYVVEHLDPELGPWSALEYTAIAKESHASSATFCLTSVSPTLVIPESLRETQGLRLETESVESVFASAKARTCLLDPAATEELKPEDGGNFDIFLFGGILGDDPPRDRTEELRKKGYEGRRLGSRQMTTDTAVRVTRMIAQAKVPFDQIPFVDDPEIKVDEHESTEMPFRYVRNEDGSPVMPEGMIDLIKTDSEKGIEDLF